MFLKFIKCGAQCVQNWDDGVILCEDKAVPLDIICIWIFGPTSNQNGTSIGCKLSLWSPLEFTPKVVSPGIFWSKKALRECAQGWHEECEGPLSQLGRTLIFLQNDKYSRITKMYEKMSIFTFCYPASASDRARREDSMWCGHLSRGVLHPIFWSFFVINHFTTVASFIPDTVALDKLHTIARIWRIVSFWCVLFWIPDVYTAWCVLPVHV